MNKNLVTVLKQVTAEYALSNLELVGTTLKEKAADETNLLRAAIMMCLTGGFHKGLRGAPESQRLALRQNLAEYLHTNNKSLDFVKTINPAGQVMRGKGFPARFSFLDVVKITRGDNIFYTSGFSGAYLPGAYTIELWLDSVRRYSGSVKLN